jgi:hypothetical protein
METNVNSSRDSVIFLFSVFILRSADWLMLQVPSSHSCPKQLTGPEGLNRDWATTSSQITRTAPDFVTNSL